MVPLCVYDDIEVVISEVLFDYVLYSTNPEQIVR